MFLTAITPANHPDHGGPAADAARARVNDWLRTTGPTHADGVFDFAAAVADPDDPRRRAAPFDAGDGLHLSEAGYAQLARAVDVRRLSGSPCLAEGRP